MWRDFNEANIHTRVSTTPDMHTYTYTRIQTVIPESGVPKQTATSSETQTRKQSEEPKPASVEAPEQEAKSSKTQTQTEKKSAEPKPAGESPKQTANAASDVSMCVCVCVCVFVRVCVLRNLCKGARHDGCACMKNPSLPLCSPWRRLQVQHLTLT